MQRYCFALDLKDNEQLIQEYEEHHRHVWKEIIKSITDAGIEAMDVYRTGNRLFMIMEVSDAFSFEKKTELERANEYVQRWEVLMWNYQQALPWAKHDEKWMLMSHIFQIPKVNV
jgi:L-rhamnose mutarotase